MIENSIIYNVIRNGYSEGDLYMQTAFLSTNS